MHVERVTAITDELHEAVLGLIPQLGVHKPNPPRTELETLISSEGASLLVARYPGGGSPIVGMLSISVYRVPTGIRSIVEDVVVDDNFRGMGIARALMQEALQIARNAGASGVSLTSNPHRVAANRLYVSMGFQKRETNAYFFKLK